MVENLNASDRIAEVKQADGSSFPASGLKTSKEMHIVRGIWILRNCRKFKYLWLKNKKMNKSPTGKLRETASRGSIQDKKDKFPIIRYIQISQNTRKFKCLVTESQKINQRL